MRRVVITGMGAITPIGNTAGEMWDSVKNGACGIGPITRYDAAGRKVTLAGEVRDFRPEDHLDKGEVRKMDRYSHFALTAAKEAIADSGLDFGNEDRSRCGVIVSSGIGGLGTMQAECERVAEKGYDRISPFFIPMVISNIAAGRIAITYGLQGMCNCVVTACAGGTNAIGDSFRHIRDGYGDVMVCGGAEASITQVGMGGFTSMRALSQETDPSRASIPFDKERSGFVMGEGAGILVLEEYGHALSRNARIYCEVIGYGTNCDAHHITAPLEDGHMAAACIRMALRDGNTAPEDIDYINAHGTSTPLGDKGETLAIKQALGEAASSVMVSSTKSMTGHLLGAGGAVEGIITALSVCHDFVPATIHYQIPDENCDLDIVPNESRHTRVSYALSNSFGFGGHNAVILMKKIHSPIHCIRMEGGNQNDL